MSKMNSKGKRRRGSKRTVRGGAQPRSESMVAIIDRMLFSPVKATLDGTETSMTVLAAIVLQLLQKAMAGDVRAYKVLLKYAGLARRNEPKGLELKFLDSAYTRALANWTVENG